LYDVQKDTKIIKHDSSLNPINATRLFSRTNRPDTLSLENDVPIDPTRERQPTLRNVLSAVPILDGYNVPIAKFINECRGVQKAISPQEEASLVILLRGKLRGRVRKALRSATICYRTTIQ